ncbi:hypothetical protein IAU59_004117 [Kwoniella sp. CBS 9459]
MAQPTADPSSSDPVPASVSTPANSSSNTKGTVAAKSLATATANVPAQPNNDVPSTPLALQPGTFQSLVPMIDDIFNTLYQQSIGGEKVSTALAAEQVAPKAKQLAQALETMKAAAMDLPGGNLSTEEVRKLTEMLDEQGEQRRQILRAFEGRSMPLIDRLGAQEDDGTLDGEIRSGAQSAI